MKNALEDLRQWTYPPEFRIAAPVWSAEFTDTLAQLARALEQQAKVVPADPAKLAEERKQRRMLADVCTGLWRARQKMVQPGTDRPREEMRRVYRHFEAAWDAFKQAGVEVRDHLGEPYSDGSGLDVAAFEPRAGITRETVVDTIKPTICFNGQLIQTGQVIVGTPEKSTKGD